MDSFELNKVLGAILGTLLFVMGIGFVAEALYHPIEGRGQGLALAEAEIAPTEDTSAAPEAQVVPIAVRLQTASADAGQKAVNKCKGCHKFQANEGNSTGPLLYDVVNRLQGSHPGFTYSAGMMAHNAAGDHWTYENLDTFVTNPKHYVEGTKMGFGGVKDPAERANILAYLATLSANPVPFPAPDTAPVATPAEPPAAAEAAAAPTAADAVETPDTTMTETSVQGTPVTETAPSTNEASPAGAPGAPSAGAAPMTTDDTGAAAATPKNGAQDGSAPAGNGGAPATQEPAPAASTNPVVPATPGGARATPIVPKVPDSATPPATQ